MKITKRQLRRIIREEVQKRVGGGQSWGEEEDKGVLDEDDFFVNREANPHDVHETRDKALAAAQHATKKVGYPQSGLLELEIHEYLTKEYGIDPNSDEIWLVADEALSIAGEIFGVGDTL